jgi:hypothetical protein
MECRHEILVCGKCDRDKDLCGVERAALVILRRREDASANTASVLLIVEQSEIPESRRSSDSSLSGFEVAVCFSHCAEAIRSVERGTLSVYAPCEISKPMVKRDGKF